jgi:hypothetical protein
MARLAPYLHSLLRMVAACSVALCSYRCLRSLRCLFIPHGTQKLLMLVGLFSRPVAFAGPGPLSLDSIWRKRR